MFAHLLSLYQCGWFCCWSRPCQSRLKNGGPHPLLEPLARTTRDLDRQPTARLHRAAEKPEELLQAEVAPLDREGDRQCVRSGTDHRRRRTEGHTTMTLAELGGITWTVVPNTPLQPSGLAGG